MIVLDRQRGLFTLHTRSTTYQMKVDDRGMLLHTYYGGRVDGADLSYLIREADRGFSPNPGEAGHCRTYSLDTLPQEYSTCGVGDFRLPSLELVAFSYPVTWLFAGAAVWLHYRRGKWKTICSGEPA